MAKVNLISTFLQPSCTYALNLPLTYFSPHEDGSLGLRDDDETKN